MASVLNIGPRPSLLVAPTDGASDCALNDMGSGTDMPKDFRLFERQFECQGWHEMRCSVVGRNSAKYFNAE